VGLQPLLSATGFGAPDRGLTETLRIAFDGSNSVANVTIKTQAEAPGDQAVKASFARVKCGCTLPGASASPSKTRILTPVPRTAQPAVTFPVSAREAASVGAVPGVWMAVEMWSYQSETRPVQ